MGAAASAGVERELVRASAGAGGAAGTPPAGDAPRVGNAPLGAPAAVGAGWCVICTVSLWNWIALQGEQAKEYLEQFLQLVKAGR
jgi:hypothetical protein